MGICFGLPTDGLIEFIRGHDFAWTRRQTGCPDIDRLRELLLDSVHKRWAIQKLARALAEAFVWDLAIAQIIAEAETFRCANGTSVASYRKAGVERKVWIATRPPDCLYCRKLNGKVIEISASYLKVGDQLVARRNMLPLISADQIDYPPLHGRCSCTIGAHA